MGILEKCGINEDDVTDTIFGKSDADILKGIRNIRLRWIDEITAEKLPTNDEDRKLVIALMRDTENEIMGRAKIRSNEKMAAGADNMARNVAEILRGYRPNAVPVQTAERTIPVELDVTDLVPGEMEEGVRTFTLEEIVGDE